MKPGSMSAVVSSRAMLIAASTPATATGAAVNGSIKRQEIVAWNSAASQDNSFALHTSVQQVAHSRISHVCAQASQTQCRIPCCCALGHVSVLDD